MYKYIIWYLLDSWSYVGVTLEVENRLAIITMPNKKYGAMKNFFRTNLFAGVEHY